MKYIFSFLIFTFICLGQTKVEDIQSVTLKNGMKIIVLEDHSIPNANMYFVLESRIAERVPGNNRFIALLRAYDV